MAIVKTASYGVKTPATDPNVYAFNCNGGNILIATVVITSVSLNYVKYGGVAMTLWSEGSISGGGNGRTRIFYMINPPSGLNNFEISQYANPKLIGLVAFSGINTSDAIEGDTKNTDGVNPQEASVSEADNIPSVGVFVPGNAWGTAYSPNSGETEVIDSSDGEWGHYATYYKIFSGSGTKTMGANNNDAILYAINGMLLLNGEAEVKEKSYLQII